MMIKLREMYWILQSRKAIRKVLSTCVICRRFGGKRTEVVPAACLEDRVKNGKVFESPGVDLAGPLMLTGNKKCWVVLLTCAIYRCVHLELDQSLSTEEFLDAFSRFCDRRGRSEYSL